MPGFGDPGGVFHVMLSRRQGAVVLEGGMAEQAIRERGQNKITDDGEPDAPCQ